MLKKYQSYLIDWHLNQRTYNIFLCFIEDYALFEEFNESQKHMGYRVSLIGKNKFKKANVNIDYSQLKIMNDFSNLYQLLEYLNEMRRFIEINTSKKCVHGYIVDLTQEYILLQLVDSDTTKNGILILSINYIDSIFWDEESGKRLENLVTYSKGNLGINDVIVSYSKRKALCEIYHSGFQTFILGVSFKIADDYLLIESLNMQNEIEGFVLIHVGLIDFICLQTRYIETFHLPYNLSASFSNLIDFFDYIISKGIKFNITTERKNIYKNCSLISFVNELLTFNYNNSKKTLFLNEIDIFDTCE